MRFFVLRHSEAEPKGGDKVDHERRLVASGEASAYRQAKKRISQLDGLEAILTSPALRAKETADIFASVLGKPEIVEECDFLNPISEPMTILRELRRYQDRENIMVVGHEPNLSQIVSLLISGTNMASIRLKKSGLAVLDVAEFSPGYGRLRKLY
ncbi:MAG: phosphohistidine phosphatase SixA [Deltaproteobacteria bacterium]|nr:phosphohistidine phosphatase SixA [Deltaproteobacteria bacterium]